MAAARRANSLRPGTKKNLLNYFRVFLSFCLYYRLDPLALTPCTVCAYIEFLLNYFKCPGTVRNYISGVTTFYAWLGKDTGIFYNFQVNQMLRAMDLTLRYTPAEKHILTIPELHQLVQACKLLGCNCAMFRSFLSLLFFSMLRVSSLLPYVASSFDPTRHPLLNDVQFTQRGLRLRLKWAKNLQASKDALFVPIFKHTIQGICPVLALQTYFATLRGTLSDRPLFLVTTPKGSVTFLTISRANLWLRLLISNTALAGQKVGFHSFRRGACNSAFNKGAPISDIKVFGCWKSDAMLGYLHQAPAQLRVASLLAN